MVSMPCMEVFVSHCGMRLIIVMNANKAYQNSQDAEYKLSVIPSGAPVLSVEAYSTFGWGQYSHDHFGLKAWGASGPYDKVYAKVSLCLQINKNVSERYLVRHDPSWDCVARREGHQLLQEAWPACFLSIDLSFGRPL
jgi:hypothetical protein